MQEEGVRVVCVCEKKCQKCLNNCIPFQAIKQNGAGGSCLPLEKIPANPREGWGQELSKKFFFNMLLQAI